MSVRHVHARPGEYIAVHRQHGGRVRGNGGGGTSRDNMGCLILVAVGVVIWLIVSLWKIILACLIIALVLWLIWIFQAPLGKAISWSAKHLWNFIIWAISKIGMTVSSVWMRFKNQKVQKNSQTSSVQHPVTPEYNNSTANYGKIIQKRK